MIMIQVLAALLIFEYLRKQRWRLRFKATHTDWNHRAFLKYGISEYRLKTEYLSLSIWTRDSGGSWVSRFNGSLFKTYGEWQKDVAIKTA